MRPSIAPVLLLLLLVLAAGCGQDDPMAPPAPVDTDAPAAITDLQVAASGEGRLRLAWTATGNDGFTGRADRWELRQAAWPADPAAWETWPVARDTVAAVTAGTNLGLTVDGLDAGRTYIFRLRAWDGAGNPSAPSNAVVATAAPVHDTTAPATVSDLIPWAGAADAVTVSWRTPGDDGPVGTATGWEVRWDTAPVTDATWDAAQAGPTGTPGPAGERQQATIGNLVPDTVYHVAVRTVDERGQWSAVSNSAAAETVNRRIWYVKSDGSGHVATIQAGINRARPGDTVLVAAGHYTWTNQASDLVGTSGWGMITFWRDVKGFTVRSEDGPDATIIDPEGRNRCMYIMGYNDGIVIEGFTFTGGDGHESPYGFQYGGGAVLHLTSPTLRNCVFRGNVGVAGGGIANVGQNSAVLENCVFEGNRAEVGGGYYGGGSIPRSFLRECTFAANQATITGGGAVIDTQAVDIIDCVFIANSSESGAGALAVYRNHESRLAGCTFVGNHSPQTAALRLRNVANLAVTNTVVAFNTGGPPLYTEVGSDLSLGCSLVFGNDVSDELPVLAVDLGGNLFSDPLFLSAGSHQVPLRPGPDSPCLPANRTGDGCGLIGALAFAPD